MKRNLVCCAAFLFFVSSAPVVFAQWDNRGCSQYGVSAAYPETIESSLWTFRSKSWDGYIDFQVDGRYLTHFGFGKWSVTPDGKGLHMANEYNDRTYEIAFTDNGFRFQGIGNNGLVIEGMLICSKYQGPGPQIPEKDAQKIKAIYKQMFSRDAEPKELRAYFIKYIEGATVEDIQKEFAQTQEYQDIVAANARKIRELEESGQLSW